MRLPQAVSHALLLFLVTPFLGVAGLFAQSTAEVPDIPPRPQAPNDQSEYRRLILENGLKVILLSDPQLNKSAAALAVAVGSLSDPPERQGLAHFLEHMLFLGTEKFPDVSEYGSFLRSNSGYSNAYTASDHTNYHFEIRHEAFADALDRFSQFFIAPLFSPEFTEREMNAVNSENQKNLENDSWREMQLRNSLYREGHPANHFSTGNRDTLQGTTREELLTFYRQHYSANRMTLALTGAATLDQLEQWARQYFSPVVNRDLPANRFPPDYLPPEPALRIVRREPIRDLRELTLEFPLPAIKQHWRSKPGELIGFILGYEGEGSLLSQLKAEGLATGLGAGAHDASDDFGSFDVSIALTPAGLEHYERVLQLFFSAVDDMRRAGYPEYLFRERRAMAHLDEMYQDKGEGTQRAVALANLLRDYPFEIAERVPYLWLEPDEPTYAEVLGFLRPDNMLAVLTAKGLPTDQTERYYGTNYSYAKETGPAYTALSSPPRVAGIHLPKPNPFIPHDLRLLARQPVRLIEESGVSLYYAQDTEFRRPMVAQVYRFRLPRLLGNLETSVLLRFYQACVNEALNEISYTAGVAGLNLSLIAELEGVQFAVSGYDASADRLLEAVANNLVNFELSEERFAAIKDRIVRDLRNFSRIDAWQYLLETRRSVVREFYYRPDEQLPIAEQVTLSAVRDFARRLYQQGRIEGLVHGNVTATQAVETTRQLVAALQTRGLPETEVLRRRLLVMEPGESLATVEKLEGNNSAFRQEYLLGGDEPEVRAATLVLASLLEEPFYTEMRTRQQLGYIVFGGAGEEERTNFAYFIIQSGDYPADELAARAAAFLQEFPTQLADVPEDLWEMVTAGVRAQLEEEDKTIAERAARLFSLAYDYGADWDRREETLAALDGLTRERLREIVTAALAPESRRMRTFLAFSRDHAAKPETKPTISDTAPWKASRDYR